MLPIFKSDFSIGKSILNLNLPSSNNSESNKNSILTLASDNKFSELILVEDSLTGFLEALSNCNKLGIKLIFGLRISVCSAISPEDDIKNIHDKSKIIIFAKNKKGCQLLNLIYSHAYTSNSGIIDFLNLKKFWTDDLLMVVPFYDSFIFNNIMSFSSCIPDFSFCSPTFFVEDNNLPFDSIISKSILDYTSEHKFHTENVQSVYYNKKTDFPAYQTYKCICNRSFSKDRGLQNPNLDHCSSDSFSFENYLKKCDI